MEIASEIRDALVAEVKRRLIDECLVRIGICVEKLSYEQVWWRPNAESNSIGNLILHLDGNVRQWILSGVAGRKDVRERQLEFDTPGGPKANELLEKLYATLTEVEELLAGLTPESLLEVKPVQIYQESVLSMLIHVTEHFSYHTGQIAWITKMLLNEQVGFYAGTDLG